MKSRVLVILPALIILLSFINQACSSNRPADNKITATPQIQNSTPSNNTHAKNGSEPEIAEIIKTNLPDFRLAQNSDYNKALLKDDHGKLIYKADFNADKSDDYAVIVVNDKTKEYRVYYLLKDKDRYRTELLFTQKNNGSLKDGLITNPIFFKPVGEAGIGERDNNTLIDDLPENTSDEQRIKLRETKLKAYISVPAIEVWTGSENLAEPGKKKAEQNLDLADLAYCSATWYYENNKLSTFNACD